MSVFQLYKKRDFSAYIGDTMQFMKQFRKDFFRNYLVINGALLLVVCVIYYFLFNNSFGNAFNPKQADSWLMYNNNFGLFAGFMFVFLIVMVTFSVFTTAYPIVYIKLVDHTDRDSFTTSELLAGIKDYAGRIIIFGLISLFIMVPIALIVMALGIVLSFILIGIPVLMLAFPTIMVWSMQSLYVYLEEGSGYFDALGKGWKITFSSYWNIVGSTLALFICVMILGSTVSLIPSFMTIGSILSSGGHPGPLTMTPFMTIIYIVGMIISYVLYNVLYVHQGMIYYSSREATEHYQTFSDIDNIGKDEE